MRWSNQKAIAMGEGYICYQQFGTFTKDDFERNLYLYYFNGLFHTQGCIWSSSTTVLILCRARTYFTKFLFTTQWGNTRSLRSDLCARLYGSQYQHASCIQIIKFTSSWIIYYLCSIFNDCLVVPFMLTSKRLFSKVEMWIIW